LKDLTGMMEPSAVEERERRIQSGGHYSETLPMEYEPGAEYLRLYDTALERFIPKTARAAALLADKIFALHGKNVVLVSLARAGTPIGVIVKRCLALKYGIDAPHYTISIIRGRGIDRNAMRRIMSRHAPRDIQFLDGWTGKGAIAAELTHAIREGFQDAAVSPDLAVLSDPPALAGLCGTREDFLIPNSCLNAAVSGLISRTVLNAELIGADDFHGAIFYEHLLPVDRTYEFIDLTVDYIRRTVLSGGNVPLNEAADAEEAPRRSGLDEVRAIQRDFGVSDVNFIKPGIGESTRALLRRVPWKLLVRSLDDDEYLAHLYQLAHEKNIPVETYPLCRYRACAILLKFAS
jgi:hypothetical protein